MNKNIHMYFIHIYLVLQYYMVSLILNIKVAANIDTFK